MKRTVLFISMTFTTAIASAMTAEQMDHLSNSLFFASWTITNAPSSGNLFPSPPQQQVPPLPAPRPQVDCAPPTQPVSSATLQAAQAMNQIAQVVQRPQNVPMPPQRPVSQRDPRIEKLLEEALYGTTCPNTVSGRKVCESVCRRRTPQYRWRGDKLADGAACTSRNGGRPSQLQCANWVRLALERAGIKTTHGGIGHAKYMGPGLEKMGFVRCSNLNSRTAPPGAVLLYNGGQYGHVEIRTRGGYVSDYFSVTPRDTNRSRPLKAVYVLGGCG